MEENSEDLKPKKKGRGSKRKAAPQYNNVSMLIFSLIFNELMSTAGSLCLMEKVEALVIGPLKLYNACFGLCFSDG